MLEKAKNRKRLGDSGETLASKILHKNGYVILERGYRCKSGEVDIIALDRDTLAFVEVKTRKTRKFGLPEEAVTKRKYLHIMSVANYYLNTNSVYKKYRIDIVSILILGNQIESKIIKGVQY